MGHDIQILQLRFRFPQFYFKLTDQEIPTGLCAIAIKPLVMQQAEVW